MIEASFGLEAAELEAISEVYGSGVLAKPVVTVSKGYERNSAGTCTLFVNVPVVEFALVRHLVVTFAPPENLTSQLAETTTLLDLSAFLSEAGKQQNEAVAAAQAAAQLLPDEAEKATALEATKRKFLRKTPLWVDPRLCS